MRTNPDLYRYDAWGQDTWPGLDEDEYRPLKGGLDEVHVSLFVAESPTRLVEAERDQALIDATSVDNECEHGQLSGDRNPTCGCWGRAA